MSIAIIYEDENFIALAKPAGVLVHPVRGCPAEGAATAALGRPASNGVHGVSGQKKRGGTVVDWLLEHYPEIKNVGDPSTCSGQAIPKRPGIVHRLDKDTSGVLVVARNQKFFEYLKKLFQEHKVVKTYLALVYGEFKGSGVIDTPIGLKSGTVKRSTRARQMKMVKEAITEYRALKCFEKDGQKFTLVSLIPKTGRTHQLRVHMASVHHPVVGDPLYGKKENPWNLQRQFLHATSIEFPLSGGRRIKLEAELPKELANVLSQLEN